MQNTPLINYGHLEDENITRSEKFVGLYKIVEWEFFCSLISKLRERAFLNLEDEKIGNVYIFVTEI